jgi:sulfate/thiosulfate transport system permease protein
MDATTTHPIQSATMPLPKMRAATEEYPLVRWSLIAVSISFLMLFLFVPLAAVFAEALRKGWAPMLRASPTRTAFPPFD